jgi:hypothetical protein
MPVESVNEVVAVLTIGSAVGDGDGARDEVALDALRRRAAGPIGVHHDRDVTVLEPEGHQALSHAWLPGAARAGIRQARAEIMSGGASTVLRPFAGVDRPPAVHTAVPGDARSRPQMVRRAGSTKRRQSRVRAAWET